MQKVLAILTSLALVISASVLTVFAASEQEQLMENEYEKSAIYHSQQRQRGAQYEKGFTDYSHCFGMVDNSFSGIRNC